MPFAGNVRTDWLNDGDDDQMVVVSPLSYLDPKGRMWSVPAGFVTDGASIPRFLWSFIGSPFNGAYRLPALFHDASYCTPRMNRSQCDRMFYDAMREEGVSVIKARLMWAGVRIGGGAPFAKSQRAAALAAG